MWCTWLYDLCWASRCGDSSTLWDLISRCAMPLACRKARAVAAGSKMFMCLGFQWISEDFHGLSMVFQSISIVLQWISV